MVWFFFVAGDIRNLAECRDRFFTLVIISFDLDLLTLPFFLLLRLRCRSTHVKTVGQVQ
jgi:hypothetical protein